MRLAFATETAPASAMQVRLFFRPMGGSAGCRLKPSGSPLPPTPPRETTLEPAHTGYYIRFCVDAWKIKAVTQGAQVELQGHRQDQSW